MKRTRPSLVFEKYRYHSPVHNHIMAMDTTVVSLPWKVRTWPSCLWVPAKGRWHYACSWEEQDSHQEMR